MRIVKEKLKHSYGKEIRGKSKEGKVANSKGFQQGGENLRRLWKVMSKESWACKCEDIQLLVGESMENPTSCHINLNKALFFPAYNLFSS